MAEELSQYIGRGEATVEKILWKVFSQFRVVSQYHIRQVCINRDEWEILDKEVQKHKFDFFVYGKPSLIIEVNYKHGDKADKKWNNIFVPIIKEANMIPVTIDDFSCKSLFKDKDHPITLGDWVDVLQALIDAGVEL